MTAAGADLTPEHVRRLLAQWLATSWDPELSLVEWRRRLVSAGWAVPSYPPQWHGRGWPAWTDGVVADALRDHGVVGNPQVLAFGLAAGTLLHHGSDQLRRRYLTRLLTGEDTWCQLFSEPGAGSDLAGLRTRAELRGDEWTVNGQKVWSTAAQHADLGLLLARTDWDAPKHRGITAFVIEMRQPGVTVRPLRQMNGSRSFNEVFLDDARVPAASVVGEAGGGWAVAKTTLPLERKFGVQLDLSWLGQARGRVFDEAREEARLHLAPHAWYHLRSGRPDWLVDRAVANGLIGDPVTRQRIARVLILELAGAWTSARLSQLASAGRPAAGGGSVEKLAMSLLSRAARDAHLHVAQASALLAGADAPLDGEIADLFLSVPAQSIGGGTDEIQRNIIGEVMLGLPREPSADRQVPFRDVRHGG